MVNPSILCTKRVILLATVFPYFLLLCYVLLRALLRIRYKTSKERQYKSEFTATSHLINYYKHRVVLETNFLHQNKGDLG